MFETKPVPPFSVAMVLGSLAEARDELVQASAGFNPSKRSDLENKITRLAVVLSKELTPERRVEVVTEFNTLVGQYDKHFSWTNQ